MKSVIFICSIFLVTSKAGGQSIFISESEYTFLTNYLEITRDQIVQTLDTISDEILLYEPMDGGWSVKECMEHILLAEEGLFSEFQKVLQNDPSDESTRHLDAWLIAKVNNRGTKVVTPLPMIESNMDREKFVEEIERSRSRILDYIRHYDQIEFRNHFGKSPYGPADAYQLLLVAAAHSMRHHDQMLEVIREYSQLHGD